MLGNVNKEPWSLFNCYLIRKWNEACSAQLWGRNARLYYCHSQLSQSGVHWAQIAWCDYEPRRCSQKSLPRFKIIICLQSSMKQFIYILNLGKASNPNNFTSDNPSDQSWCGCGQTSLQFPTHNFISCNLRLFPVYCMQKWKNKVLSQVRFISHLTFKSNFYSLKWPVSFYHIQPLINVCRDNLKLHTA